MIKMNRRRFLKNVSLETLAATSGVPFLTASASGSKQRNHSQRVQSDSIPLPTPAQINWQEAERVAVFHYDLHVFDGKHYVQSRNRITPIEDYNIFNPEKLDTDQWIKSIKDAGFKIAILTATHETGFALYQSDVNPYCLKAVKWRDGEGDLVRDFVESCRKYDIEPGIYVGIRWNSFYGVHDFKMNGEGQFAQNRQDYYNRMCEEMVEELTSRYGDIAIIWFDGGAYGPELGGPDVLSIFEKNQPNSLFYHNLQRADIRWGGSETGTVSYPCWGTFPYPSIGAGETAKEEISANNFQLLKTGDPEGDYYMPAMSDAPLRGHGGHDWFWEPDREHTIYPLDDLVEMHYKSVGRNSTLILGLTPDPSGLLPKADVERLKAWGREIDRRFENPVAQSEGRGSVYVINFESEESINHVVIQEDISHGERVRMYTVEGMIDGNWQEICTGSCIGHKRIQQFETRECSAVKLTIDESVGELVIKNFSVFNVE